MAKMFYTLEEVCSKLEKSEDDVREMVSSGQLQEFRDRDRLMFKVEQIDLIAGGDEDTTEVHLELEDTSGASGLGLSGTGPGLADSREGTGVSVFDTDSSSDLGSAEDSSGDSFGDEMSLEAVGSGSGLLDLTRESDDTSLGAELLEEVYSGEENIEIPANASGLFEAAAADPIHEEAIAAQGIAAMPMVVEVYDGSGSGLAVGMMIGAVAALICVAVVAIVGAMGGTPQLAITFAGKMGIFAGALLGVTVIFGLIGLFIGKASE